MNQPYIPTHHVIIRGIDIPFMDLVSLWVKLALAAIPAILVLAALFGSLFGLLMTIVRIGGH